ncbi:MAG TPA: LytTR family DNA-binding domain-containing protein [Rubricoccaceae bacterium]|jgi:two-component system LytT family response regulator
MTVLVVDDEALGRERLRRLLEAHADVTSVHLAADGQQAAEAIRSNPPDLVFLDVQMPHLDGFGVVEAVGPAAMPLVVFVTAYDAYALRAFEAHALDYLLKPFDDDRFERALDRARDRLRERRASSLGEALAGLVGTVRGDALDPAVPDPPVTGAGTLDRFPVRSGGRVVLVPAVSVDWIESDGPYALLHVGSRTHAVRVSMRELEDRLDARRFIRVHRSAIVHLDRVRELRDMGRGEYQVVLHDGTELRLSRSRRAHLERRLGLSL